MIQSRYVDAPQQILFDPCPINDVKQAAGGRYHSAVVTTNGRHYTWGLDDNGRLGFLFSARHLWIGKKYVAPNISVAEDAGTVKVGGWTPIIIPETGNGQERWATAVACGPHHTVFIGEPGVIKSAGVGANYRLGGRSTRDRTLPQSIPIFCPDKNNPDMMRDLRREVRPVWAGAGETYSMIAIQVGDRHEIPIDQEKEITIKQEEVTPLKEEKETPVKQEEETPTKIKIDLEVTPSEGRGSGIGLRFL